MFRRLGDWATKKTIRVQVNRILRTGGNSDPLNEERQRKIIKEVLHELSNIFIKEPQLLKKELRTLISIDEHYWKLYEKIVEVAVAKYGKRAQVLAAYNLSDFES